MIDPKKPEVEKAESSLSAFDDIVNSQLDHPEEEEVDGHEESSAQISEEDQ